MNTTSVLTSLWNRHKSVLKLAMKVLVVLGVVYGAMACFGSGSSQASAAESGPKVTDVVRINIHTSSTWAQ